MTFYRTGGTDTSDAVCEYRGTCDTGTEFHANTAAATADTECVEFTERAAVGTEYQSASRTVAADNECTTVSEDCPVGTAFKSAEASLTGDRVCTPLKRVHLGRGRGHGADGHGRPPVRASWRARAAPRGQGGGAHPARVERVDHRRRAAAALVVAVTVFGG